MSFVLVVAQQARHVHSRAVQRRSQADENGDDQDPRCDGEQDRGIERLHPEQEGPDRAGSEPGEQQAGDDADSDEACGVGDDRGAELQPARAEGAADGERGPD